MNGTDKDLEESQMFELSESADLQNAVRGEQQRLELLLSNTRTNKCNAIHFVNEEER